MISENNTNNFCKTIIYSQICKNIIIFFLGEIEIKIVDNKLIVSLLAIMNKN